MASKQLESLEIYPGKNSGHRIVHHFKRQAATSRRDGMYIERPPDEEHNFGPEEKQQHAIMTHIAGALGFTKVAKAEGAEDKEMASENEAEGGE